MSKSWQLYAIFDPIQVYLIAIVTIYDYILYTVNFGVGASSIQVTSYKATGKISLITIFLLLFAKAFLKNASAVVCTDAELQFLKQYTAAGKADEQKFWFSPAKDGRSYVFSFDFGGVILSINGHVIFNKDRCDALLRTVLRIINTGGQGIRCCLPQDNQRFIFFTFR